MDGWIAVSFGGNSRSHIHLAREEVVWNFQCKYIFFLFRALLHTISAPDEFTAAIDLLAVILYN